MKREVGLACLLLWSCAFGGSKEDPRVPVGEEPGSAAGPSDDSVGSEEVSSSDPPETNGDSGKTGSGSRPTMEVGRPSSGANSEDGKEAGSSEPADSCRPSQVVALCDPVRNTGCPPLTQCDIDTAATTATGRCVFFQAAFDPNSCMATFVNTTCAAQSTCVGNRCRKLCYCDGDRPAGECCADTSGPGPAGAFKLCRPC